jgi:dihydropteroate synthase
VRSVEGVSLPPVQCRDRVLRVSSGPLIMGILNVTPDSFSDGGCFLNPDTAVAHGLRIQAEGADVIDVGGESSRPGSEPISVEEEIRRVVPVIEKLVRQGTVPVSIDTTKAAVAEAALDVGASLINDISALRSDPHLGEIAARSGCGLILMHMRGVPKTMQTGELRYADLMGEIRAFLADALSRAEAAGVPRDRVILDPGIGFGKTPAHNLTIVHRLAELACLERPIMVGPSRKAFIGAVLNVGVGERLSGTAAVVAAAVLHGAHIVRVHDVTPMRQVAQVAYAIRTERLPDSVA